MPDEKLARALRARARRRILEELVKSGPLSVGEIAEKVGIAEYNASKHLKLLCDLGVVEYTYDPPKKIYYVSIPEMEELLKAYNAVASKLAKR
ncbi:ArsR/SmtB family transcription factor [Archaeoglobus profundus]|uniref:Transcriptional regulator n=1 Tax=Archaeoglobus profundus (strain DSM 5631 / JCM 9629 / NBRC 100127 / Av18) TaxID=572546 RepID=D2RHF4_ARCPA|nr:helix-turn-helix domain-containing protein [Archaeoglobus profundus]ADB57729.1 putative transcriptional regulator [Archaeoglobus profundus DSM 5631]